MYNYTIIKDKKGKEECLNLFFKHAKKLYSSSKKFSKFFIAAIYDEKVIGCMGVGMKDYGNYNFSHLIVHPDHRRKGIGTEIIRHSVPLLKEEGAWLITNHKSSDLMPYQIFEDLGFKLVGKRILNRGFKEKLYQLNLAYLEQTIEE